MKRIRYQLDITRTDKPDDKKSFHGTASEVGPCLMKADCVHPIEEKCEATGMGGGEIAYEASNAGSMVSSGVNSEAYRSGWERIWGADNKSNAN